MKTSPSRSPVSDRRRSLRASALDSGRLLRRRPLLEVLEGRTLLSTFAVTSTDDSGPGSLRQAILDSNAANDPTTTIDFAIPGAGVQTIQPRSALPALTAPVLIDGFSQPGYTGTPLIELNGSQAGGGSGLAITGSGVTVRGLDINSFGLGAGILIAGASASGNWIYGNVIGTDPTGAQNEPNEYGVVITGGAANNRVGSRTGDANAIQEANLISGNVLGGVNLGVRNYGFATGAAGVSDPLNLNGSATIQDGSLQLTDLGPGLDGSNGDFRVTGQTSSAFLSAPVDVGRFSTQFEFQLSQGQGQGFTFTIQNQGAAALGSSDEGLGYGDKRTPWWFGSIGQSVAIKFDLNNDNGEGNNSTGLYTNGTNPDAPAVDLNGTGIDFHSGDVFKVAMSYDGTTLFVTITDTTTGASAAQSYPVDIPGTVGGSSAYVGFTGSTTTDGLANVQKILNWSYGWSSLSAPGVASDNQVQGNVITRNSGPGVIVVGTDSIGNAIVGNQIFGNTGQAIDLGNDGVTVNGTTPAQGPNNPQNAPILFGTAGGGLHGLLQGGTPNTTFAIDVFAGTGYGPGGAGEGEEYLGTLQVTTDGNGQVSFIVPFAAPSNLPILTATATDPRGSTSEISAARPASLQAPTGFVIVVPNQPLVFSSDPANAVVLQDSSLGTVDPGWAVTLAVTDGVLSFATLDGLSGSGNGTGALSYQGTLSAINAALASLTYTPPPGFKGGSVLSLSAQSTGIAPLQAQVNLLVADGQFAVTTTSDSGPGSLRQAILDSNNFPGTNNTIAFAIPGSGAQTIQPLSPLPSIDRSVLIDGFSQPGYAGTPVIELNGDLAEGGNGLELHASGVIVRGLAINGWFDPSDSGEFTRSGVLVTDGTNDWIYGNVIGTDPTGTQAKPNGRGIAGFPMETLIGTNGDGVNDAAESNLISGNAYAGVAIFFGHFNDVVGNVITGNTGPGVVVGRDAGGQSNFSVGNRVSANRIFGNTGPAIDVAQNGVTANAPDPRSGPNKQQNFPVIVNTADGGVQGRLFGSTPNTTFQIEVFASAGSSPGGSGEGQEYLGTFQVTTDADGSALFTVPFTAPSDLPIITATATDPDGNTSEISALRQGVLKAPVAVRLGSGHSVIFSAPGPVLSIRDPDAGPIDPAWQITLSVPVGTLTLSTLAGLVGSGQGTGSLVYQGSLSAIDSALAGLTYTPPPGDHLYFKMTVTATSTGAKPLQSQFVLSDGLFAVTTTADSGPGSLRQAILDANAVTTGRNTIDFAIPGTGLQTIAPASPLPAITNPLVIDATSQPGFAGTPLVVLSGQSLGTSDPLRISGAATLRGVKIDGFTFGQTATPAVLALQSVAFPGAGRASSGAVDRYKLVTTGGDSLTVIVSGQGVTTRLLLRDATGNVVTQSDGQSNAGGESLISLYVPAGTYSLDVQSLGGSGTYSLTASGSRAANPSVSLPLRASITVPSSVIPADFNGDGNLDLAVGMSNNGTIGVYLGNGDGTFQPVVFSGVTTSAMVAGDFDGDGKADLASVRGSTLSVLFGIGDGTFKPAVPYSVAGSSNAIAASDFNGDGRIDLAVTSRSERTVSVLLGNGDGTFQRRVKYTVGTNAGRIVAGDFNGDGRIDLATVNENTAGTVSLLIGNGDGKFAAQRVYDVGASPQGIVAADFNGDGRLDLAVTNQTSNGTVSVLLGTGDGAFQPRVAYAAGISPDKIVKGDFNHDGTIDLEIVNGRTGLMTVVLGKGDGSFLPPVTFNTTGQAGGVIATGDFNHDGRLDFAYANGGASNGPRSSVEVRLGQGDGTFQRLRLPSGISVNSNPRQAAAGDFNGDGRMDLAVTTANDTVSLLLGNGDGTFAQPTFYPTGKNPGVIVAGDFNGDGRLDLAVTTGDDNTVSVLLGNGDGTFAAQTVYAVANPDGMVAGDFNGDGRIDLAVVNGGDNNSVSVLLGKGDGTFASAVAYAVANPGGIAAGDFNGDGRTDLAVVNRGANTVSILAGKGDGAFAPPAAYDAGTLRINEIAAGDFNGDGNLDLAVSDNGKDPFGEPSGNTGFVSVLLGKGDGTFPSHVEYGVDQGPGKISVGDFNGDGHLDLGVANYFGTDWLNGSSSVSVLLGHGDGTFASQVSYQVPSFLSSIIAANFNGRVALASLTASDKSVSVKLINRDGTFADPGQFALTPLATPLVAHVNGDATADVLVVDALGNILYRQGVPGQTGSFAPPVTVNPDTPSRDIVWLPRTEAGPLIASVDAHDDSVSLYAFRDGAFVKVRTLATGSLPAQVVAADLNHDGWTDLVVRNADDGTLSVFFGTALVGPRTPQFNVVPQFLSRVTVPVGLGVSDVQAVDATGGGRLDLVVTNKVTGQVGILANLGGGAFAPLAPYRAGAGLVTLNPASTPKVASLEGTLGVAFGPLRPGAPVGLVTIDPGTRTLGVIAGLGDGRFANPVPIQTRSPARVVRMADLTGDDVNSLAVLTADGVNIYRGDGRGGFSDPVTYETGPDPTGLTVADLDRDGHADLLVGNAYGDVLFLVGKGDGTFRPYTKADQGVALAVADLTGDGKPDFVYASQGLDRVAVQYGGDQAAAVLGDRSSGLLAPGAVKLADLTGDGVKDLIVANSGSNNILVYPGLGNGQFGPATNGGHGYFAGTNPTGIEVANLNGQPDLIVANAGSNDVSILLGQGSGSNWTLTPGPRIKTAGGPVAVAVGNLTGKGTLDLAVANQQANNVQVFPGIGGGFFGQTPTTYAVGQAPSGLFLGNFNGSGLGIAALNSGSNTVSLIGQNGVTQTINAGGLRPSAGIAGDFSGKGFTDLVVGNSGDGRFSLLTGGPGGLSLSLSTTSAAVPSPTSLSFAGVSDGVLSFYAASAGHEAASLLAFSLDGQGTSPGGVSGGELGGGTGQSAGSVLTAATTGAFQQAAQLLGLNGSALDLIAPLLTVSVVPGEFDDAAEGTGEVALLANFLPSTGVSVAQPLASKHDESHSGGDDAEGTKEEEEGDEAPEQELPVWEQLAVGMDQAWEQLRDNRLEHEGIDPDTAIRAVSKPDRDPTTPLTRKPAPRRRDQTQPRTSRRETGLAPLPEAPRPADRTDPDVVAAAIAELAEEPFPDDRPADPPTAGPDGEPAIGHDSLNQPLAAAMTLVSMDTLARWIRSTRGEQARRARRIFRTPVSVC